MKVKALAPIMIFMVGMLAQDTSAQLSEDPVVAKIDHIVVKTEDPGQLFSAMNGLLGLPVAWPIANYPGFTTGGIHTGNVNIEIIKFDEAQKAPSSDAGIFGIVFEPTPLGENISELKNRGVSPGDPEPQYSKINGTDVKIWTNVMLNGLFGQEYIVYLVEYSPEAALKLSKRIPAEPKPLGKIGLLSVKEIVVGATDINRTRSKWQRFLGVSNSANASAQDSWQIGEGPAIRLAHSERDRIESMVWRVESLDKAKAYLAETHMIGNSSQNGISINPAAIQGLNIRLIEE